MTMTRQEKAKADFWKAAYLEAMESAMKMDWTKSNKPQTSVEQRCDIAAQIADESLKLAEKRGFV